MNHIDAMKQALDVIETISIVFKQTSGEYEISRVVNNLRKAIEEAEKNQFNPDWNAINLLSEENLALHKRIAELEAEKPKWSKNT
jgi:hypothetical protein